MSGAFVQTNRSGVFKEQSETPGNYEQGDLGRVVLPEVSGLGGFGGPGEYKKYPEVVVDTYNMEDKKLEKIGSKVIPEINFLSPPSDSSNAPDRGVHTAEETPSREVVVVEQPSSKRKSKKKVTKVRNDEEVVMVTFSGIFGKTTVPYEKVFFSGINLILIAETEGPVMQYSPPENEDGFEVSFNEHIVKAYAVGIDFMFPGTTKKVTVLLIDKGN